MNLSGIVKFLLGFLLAIAILFGGGIAAALYFVAKLTIIPPRPTFANENKLEKPKKSPNVAGVVSSAASPSPTPTPKALPPGAYRARVTWSEGLAIRDRPGRDANTVGGIEFNGRVVVLEETPDKKWQRIRIDNSDREGWVIGGNTQKVEE